ncbi:MAG: cyclic nucleotide-binding domain-containing protein [Thermodesulfobacteriota bacterium]
MTLLLLGLLWGCVSAVSLPLGAVIGLWTNPSRKVTSALMAFGGGALLFALTIELFAHSLHRAHEGHDVWIILITMIGAALGGLLFESLNKLLNNWGAFLRKGALLRRHVQKFKRARARKMVESLSKVKILQVLPPEEVVQLIPHVRTKRYSKGQAIFRQGEPGEELFFVVSGIVQVVREHGGESQVIAELETGDTFGEIALISNQPRTGTVRAVTDVELCSIHKSDFERLLEHSPELTRTSREMVEARLLDMQQKDDTVTVEARMWAQKAVQNLDRLAMPVTGKDVEREVKEHAGGGAALAIWLGIALDGIPESLVIGMLVVSAVDAGTTMSLAFIAGVFLANLPEAMSSSVTMKRQGSGFNKVVIMWMSLCILTGLGAMVGAMIFPAHPVGGLRYFISCIEGLAAGAMLAMIAETMLPEAFEQGGDTVVGLSTLAGFLSALGVKLTSLY